MGNDFKPYCETHHLYYNGDVCPFCQSEKMAKIIKSNNPQPIDPFKKPKKFNKSKKTDKEIDLTPDIIEKLQNHFKK